MVSLTIAGLLSLAWAVAALWVGPAVGWVDRPDNPDLKVHERPAVPLGGIGVFLGVHVALIVSGRLDGGLLAATAIVLVLGLVDDRVGLSPVTRLVVEVVAGVVLVTTADVAVTGWFGVVVGTALVVFAINAVNLYDGLDGLVGATAAVSALGLAWLTGAQFAGDPVFGLVLAGALAGFLVMNWNPAKVFLGDNGAYTVAVMLAYGILRVPVAHAPDRAVLTLVADAGVPAVVWTAMGLLGVFALDLFITLLRRRLHGRPLFEGDRSHVYDQLRDRGRSVRQVALLSAAVQGVLVVLVVAADRLLGGYAAVAFLVLVMAGALVAARWYGFLRVD